MSTDLGNRSSGSGADQEQTDVIAAGGATQADSIGAAVKDFLTTPQVSRKWCCVVVG